MSKFVKTAELRKLGFNPESFTRVTPSDNVKFLASYEKDTAKDRVRHSFSTPWAWILAATGLDTHFKAKADSSESAVPLLASGLLAIVAVRRWRDASKKEQRRFVKEYNEAMGTTFRMGHPKMQAMWDLAHAKANNNAPLYKQGEYYPDRVYQTPGYDSNAEWRKMRSMPTTIAIRRLGEEWMDRKPPKGIYKEVKIPIRVRSHNTRGVYKYAGFFDEVNKNWNYGKYLVGHKINVYRTGRELGVPRGKLLKHDIGKFHPREWKPYAAYWFGPKGIKGTKDPKVQKTFRAAADKHYTRNEHHAYRLGKPYTVDTELESLADWYSVSRSVHFQLSDKKFPTFKKWFQERGDKLNVRPATRKHITSLYQN